MNANKTMPHQPIDWDTIGLQVAHIIAQRSKDPHTRVGCVLMSPDKRQIHWGYNGFPAKFPESVERWQRPEKYKYVCHSELNAIINAKTDLSGWTAYLTMFPCEKCALLLVQAGIKRIVYSKEYSGQTGNIEFAKSIFNEAGVIYERKTISDD